MSSVFQNIHVLADRIPGFAVPANSDHLQVVRRPVIFSVLSPASHASWAQAGLDVLPDVSVRAVSLGEWLLVSENVTADSLSRDLGLMGSQRLSFFEQSDGRVLLRLSGPNVRAILSKCVAVDLHPDVFAEGYAANMLCCHVTANVARTGVDTFEIAVMRSYAGSVFDEVMEMGREFGLTSGFSD